MTEEEQLRQQSNPRIDDGRRRRRFGRGGPTSRMVMAESSAERAGRRTATQSLDSVQIRGVTKEYNDIPSTQIERGRPITPGEFDAGRSVAILGWDVGRPAVRPAQSARQDDHDRRRALPRRRRRAEEGHDLRPVAGRVRRDPARRRCSGSSASRMSLRLTVRPHDPDARAGGDGRHARGAAHRAAPAAEADRTTSASCRRTRSSTSTAAPRRGSSRCSSASSASRSSSAASSS